MRKLLLITLILVTVTLTGVLQGSVLHHEDMEYSALSEANRNLYPATMTFDVMIHYPF